MSQKRLNWKSDLNYPVCKGATEQRFTATVDGDDLEIDTHPWGEAGLKINGNTEAHVEGKLSGGDAFREIEDVAEEIENRNATGGEPQTKT